MNEPSETRLSLKISRRFNASPKRVFDAWLTKFWGEWLPPPGATCEVMVMEPYAGGRFHIKMAMPDGRTVTIGGVYREVTRPEKLVMSWKGDYSPDETIITLTFKADGDGTIMTLHQDGFSDSKMRDGYQYGWTSAGGAFDKLDLILAR